MKALMGVAVTVAALGALTATSADGATKKMKECQSAMAEARAPQHLRIAGGARCDSARLIADQVVGLPPKGCVKTDKKGKVSLRAGCTVKSYTCKGSPLSKGKALSVKCTKGTRVVQFRY
jgi:hypothetical protein